MSSKGIRQIQVSPYPDEIKIINLNEEDTNTSQCTAREIKIDLGEGDVPEEVIYIEPTLTVRKHYFYFFILLFYRRQHTFPRDIKIYCRQCIS